MACPEICKAGELSGVMKTFENWLWQWLQDYKYPKAMKSYTSNEWTEWNMGYISIKLLFKKKKNPAAVLIVIEIKGIPSNKKGCLLSPTFYQYKKKTKQSES